MPETTRRDEETRRARKTEGEQAAEAEEQAGGVEELEQGELGAELEEEVGALVAIAMMDAEAAAAYGAAADVVDDDGIRETILSFQKDHLRHVDDLNAIITERGGNAVRRDPAMGSVMVTLAQSMGALGTDEAILALVGNEQLTNSVYATALELGLDEKTVAVLERNKADEERHLETLEELSSDVEEEVDDEPS